MSAPAGSALPRSTPREQGVDANGVAGFLDAVERRDDVELHSLMVLRHGHVVAEGWWAPYTPERLHLLYSLSKSFTSAALGLAVAEGLLGLDDTVLQHLPHLAGDDVAHDPRLRHLAAMASGHTWDTWDDVVTTDPEEPVRAFLRLAPDGEPGTRFAYNQSCTYTIATVLQQLTGTTLTEYLRPRLLDPLGIGEMRWNQLPAGRDVGFSGLHGRTEDVARLGLLHLQQGRWGDAQVLPARVGPRGDHTPGLDRRRGQDRLGPGLRLPVLGRPARLPRRRRLRPVLRGAAGAGRRRGRHRRVAGHAGRARRDVGAPAARVR